MGTAGGGGGGTTNSTIGGGFRTFLFCTFGTGVWVTSGNFDLFLKL